MRDVKKLSRTLELERWTLSEARELISAEDWQRLMIQREVNRMDPDFQCADAAQCIKQPRPLVEVLSKTER